MPTNKLPALITPALLSSIKSYPSLPRNSWYFIAGVTLSALNRPDEIPNVFSFALEKGTGPDEDAAPKHEEQLRLARRMREGLVKSAAILGLPKTINALLALKTGTPENLLDPPLNFSPSSRAIELASTPPSVILQRGQRLFDRVYGKVSNRVMGQMDNSGTEDLGLTARLEYGYILSAGDGILTPAETSWVLLAGLIPQDVNPQLKGHLKGALNNGGTLEEVRAVRDVVIKICEEAGMKKLKDGMHGWGWTNEIANL